MIAARMGRDAEAAGCGGIGSRSKVSVMREALVAKFEQHPQLRDLLLSTGDAKLVEHTDRTTPTGATAATAPAATCSASILMEVRRGLASA